MRRKRRELVPLETTRCGNCVYLRFDEYRKSYSCVQNRVIPHRVPPYFAEKCASFREREMAGFIPPEPSRSSVEAVH